VPSCGPASTWISCKIHRQKKSDDCICGCSLIFIVQLTCGGSGSPLANVRKSVYAPGASSDTGGGGWFAWPGARKCFALTVTRYCVLGASP
jgi:hypothetical protein